MVAVFFTAIGVLMFAFAILWYQRLRRLAGRRITSVRSRGFGGFALLGWILMNLLGLLLTGPLVVLQFVLMILYRAGERRALMETLAAAARKNIPLSVAARSFALDRTDDFATRTVAFADALDTGSPFRVALLRARISLPASATLALRMAGETDNDLARSLQDASSYDAKVGTEIIRFVERAMNCVVTLAFLISVFTFVCVMVMPTYQQIFEDFAVELPAITEMVITFAEFVSKYVALIVAFAVVFVWYAAYQLFRWLGFNFPRLHPLPLPLLRAFYSPILLRAISRAIDDNVPLQDGIRNIAVNFPDQQVAKRVTIVADGVDRGGCWIEALRKQKLITVPDEKLLKSSQQLGNVNWAICEVANRKTERLTHKLNLLTELVSPIPTILIAIPIGFFGVAMMLPLSVLIQNLSL
ncbi:MAG: type II secretion system F family protein [Planctomycetales bacterium]|nr:type II secretion system F family protein [Planctomycetales bacterium]